MFWELSIIPSSKLRLYSNKSMFSSILLNNKALISEFYAVIKTNKLMK